MLAGCLLLAAAAGCGGKSQANADAANDAPLVPVWPADNTVASCDQYATLAVGAYVLQSNYWNKDVCPGTQCIEFNNATGAFSVTSGAEPCGDNVVSYPNVLYGCAFGNCSPGTMLPMQVSKVKTVTSTWSWDIAGAPTDRYNVAYDIWFCPDANCGTTGFGKGLELMIWLEYQNVFGWRTSLGVKDVAGHTWEIWKADMLVGQSSDSWTYLTYMMKSRQVSSLKDFDLGAFIKDAVAGGHIPENWYLYAIQAGVELRTGGIPYNHNGFTVTINGVTPSPAPAPYTGPSCDGGSPTTAGTLAVADNYVTAGPLHGYGSAWTWVGPTSSAVACGSPHCSSEVGAADVTCSSPLGPSALCIAGTVTADPTYNSVAGVGFNLNQPKAGAAVDAGVALDAGAVDGGSDSRGTITIPNSITVFAERMGTNLTGNNSLRVQMTDVNGALYCYGGPINEPIPVGKLNTKCWNNTGEFATSATQFKTIDLIVPSSAAVDQVFSYCVTNVVVQ